MVRAVSVWLASLPVLLLLGALPLGLLAWAGRRRTRPLRELDHDHETPGGRRPLARTVVAHRPMARDQRARERGCLRVCNCWLVS